MYVGLFADMTIRILDYCCRVLPENITMWMINIKTILVNKLVSSIYYWLSEEGRICCKMSRLWVSRQAFVVSIGFITSPVLFIKKSHLQSFFTVDIFVIITQIVFNCFIKWQSRFGICFCIKIYPNIPPVGLFSEVTPWLSYMCVKPQEK